ncbi:MAG: hypothetical protein ACLU99_02475 [Alphaproteobacteria bacterium]
MFSNLTPNANIGRVDKTKIVMVLNGTNREKALAIAQKIMKESVPAIRQLGVDEYNAQMIVITYSDRKTSTTLSRACGQGCAGTSKPLLKTENTASYRQNCGAKPCLKSRTQKYK